MNKLLILLCFLLFVQAPAIADNAALRPEVVEPRKIAFRYRHPKIYKIYRKTRTVCIGVAPIVNVGANIVTAVAVVLK